MTVNAILTVIDRIADSDPALYFLLDISVKASLVLALAFLLQILLLRKSAFVKSILWTVTFISLLSLPLFHGLLPAYLIDFAYEASVSSGSVLGPSAFFSELSPDTKPVFTLGNTVISLYLAVSFLLFLHFVLGIFRVWSLTRLAEPFIDNRTDAVLQELKYCNGIHCKVELLTSRDISSPLTWGVIEHRIFLPSAASDWDRNMLKQVISHELAHVQRRDWLQQSISHLATCVFWMNPLVWIAKKKYLLECEKSCDDKAVIETGSAISYAENLLRLAKSISARPSTRAICLLGRNTELSDRIRHILRPDKATNDLDGCGNIPCIVIALLVLAPLSATSISLQAQHSDFQNSTLIRVSYFPKESAEYLAIMSQFARGN